MNSTDLAFTPALEQAKLIRTRQISPLELVELYLGRIEELNSDLGSFFHVATETALADAQAKTEQLAKTQSLEELPLFFGVPTAIKDLNAVAGMPLTYGNPALQSNIANYDDGIVTKMKLAGFTILGKTATSEFGSLPYTEPMGFPPARNPWNLNYTPGGSSGGAAAAVAAGLCPIAQGSDGGGSVRGPAFCCGLVGVKPSRGRVSYAPLGDHQSGIATNGILARTVADAAALLDVMAGYITGDPYWLPNPTLSFLEASRQTPKQLKIAFSTFIPPIGEPAEACQQAVQETAQTLASMGHILEEGCPDFTELIPPFIKIWQAGVAATGLPLEALSPINRWIASQAVTAGEYLQAVHKMQLVSRQIVAFFDNVDVLLLPTYMDTAITIGEWANLDPEETLQKIIAWIAPCPGFNASGLPSIAVPAGFAANGLPVGIQLVGKPASEAILLALAAQLEEAKPWIFFRSQGIGSNT